MILLGKLLLNIFFIAFLLLIIIILVLSSLIYFFEKLKTNKEKQKLIFKQSLSELFDQYIENKNKNLKNIDLRYLDILVEVLAEKLTKNKLKQNNIKYIKDYLVDNIILPKVISFYNSKELLNRYYISVLLNYSINILKYESELIALINDPRLIIKVNAIMVGARNPTKKIVHAIVNRLYLDKTYKKRFMAIYYKVDKNFKKYIYEELINAKDPYWKVACYSLITLDEQNEYYFDEIKEDLNSNIVILQLKAIKAMGELNIPKIRPYLAKMLLNPNWKIRNKVIKVLENTKAVWGINYIAHCVLDSSSWVRSSAINALISFGTKGKAQLENKIAELNPDSEINKEILYYIEVSKNNKII